MHMGHTNGDVGNGKLLEFKSARIEIEFFEGLHTI